MEMQYYYNREVKLLLVNQSNEKEKVKYQSKKFQAPKIGPRPPYYMNPRYEPYKPVI